MDLAREISAVIGVDLQLLDVLVGGEQNGAHLVQAPDGQLLVVKLQSEPWKARRMLRAAPAIAQAVAGGWPAAPWLATGKLSSGAAFVVQEYLDGKPIESLDTQAVAAILAANDLQAGQGYEEAFDDSTQLAAVLSGDCGWKGVVEQRSAVGSDVVRRGDHVVDLVGPQAISSFDVVHGDYSTSNMLLTDDGRVRFIDCETVARGHRVRDLADLYRQCFVYPGTPEPALAMLRSHACAIASVEVFVTCVVAVSYNNLAWMAEHKTETEFDSACRQVERLFDTMREL